MQRLHIMAVPDCEIAVVRPPDRQHRHASGNLSFFLDATRPLVLAPIYDMQPMHYRPASNAEIFPRQFDPPLPLPGERADWQAGCAPALDCWARIASDVRVSMPFREIARGNSALLSEVRGRL